MRSVTCPKCGAVQEGGKECLRCGVIFARYRPQAGLPRKDEENSGTPPPSRTVLGMLLRFYRVFRWVSLGVALVLIGLILRQPPLPRIESDPRAEERAAEKFREMQQAADSGQPYKLQLNETELNSWLGRRIVLAGKPPAAGIEGKPDSSSPPAGDPTAEQVRSTVRDVKIQLLDDRLRGYVIFDFHGKDLSLMIEGRLQVRSGYLRLEPTAGKLGSLPLPQASLESAVARLFDSPENREKFRLPPEIGDVRVQGGELIVSHR